MFITKIIRNLIVLAAVFVCASQTYASHTSADGENIEQRAVPATTENIASSLSAQVQLQAAPQPNCCERGILSLYGYLGPNNPNQMRNQILFVGAAFAGGVILSAPFAAPGMFSPEVIELFNTFCSLFG